MHLLPTFKLEVTYYEPTFEYGEHGTLKGVTIILRKWVEFSQDTVLISKEWGTLIW